MKKYCILLLAHFILHSNSVNEESGCFNDEENLWKEENLKKTMFCEINDGKSKISTLGSYGIGRLGNQMSAFATLYSLHRDRGYKFHLFPHQLQILNQSFTSEIFTKNYVQENTKDWIRAFKDYDYTDDSIWEKYKYEEKLDIGPYPNSLVHYMKYLKELKQIFHLKDEYTSEARRRLLELADNHMKKKAEESVKENLTFVSLHVRRSDYSQHLKTWYNSNLVSESYFLKAFQYFRKRFKNLLFYVVSDDPLWCQLSILNLEEDIYFIGTLKTDGFQESKMNSTQQAGIDFALLSMANHSILTYGTFGQWGAIFAGGKTVLPKSHKNTKESKEISDAKMSGWSFI